MDIDVKAAIGEVLKKLGIVKPHDTGQLIIHLNDGGISKIVKSTELK
jgi:hypothetical protein